MFEPNLPTVDTDFIIDQLISSGKIHIDKKIVVGDTFTFIAIGTKSLHKRLIILRSINGQINFDQAITLSFRYGFVDKLSYWYLVNRKWKDGGYLDDKSESLG